MIEIGLLVVIGGLVVTSGKDWGVYSVVWRASLLCLSAERVMVVVSAVRDWTI